MRDRSAARAAVSPIFETSGHPGTVVEISDISGGKGRFFQHIRKIAETWDGSDPVRVVQSLGERVSPGRITVRPPFTLKVCLVIMRLSSATRNSARLAISAGTMASGRTDY